MDITTRQFKVGQQPPTALYILSIFGVFILSGVVCLSLAWMIGGQYSMILFPFGPVVLTGIVVLWLLNAPCTITVDNSGITIAVTRNTIGIPMSTRFWPWRDLYRYEYFVNRGAFLILTLNGDTPVFRAGELGPLRDFLRAHFPEKEKKRRWGLF